MIGDITKVPTVRKNTFISIILNSFFIQGDSYSLLLFKFSNNLYIITDNSESFPFASLIQKLAILCLICVTSGGLHSSPYSIPLEVDSLTCNTILQNLK